MNSEQPVIFIDGECVMCNWLAQFVLARDESGHFRFATLQGDYARTKLVRHGFEPGNIQSVYLLLAPDTERERVLERSAAALQVLAGLGGAWSLLASLGTLLPSGLRDILYGWVSRNRYRLFGKRDVCMVPQPEWRDRFMDSA